jgi:hypothetical protein
MASLAANTSAGVVSVGGDTATGGSNSGVGGNGSRESSEFEFVGNRQITPNPLFFHANQQSLLFQTVQEIEGISSRHFSHYPLTKYKKRHKSA